MADENEVGKSLLNLPGVTKIKAPVVSSEDRKNYLDVVKNYKPLIAELAMERMVDGLVTGEPEGLVLLKIMAPYMFKKEAQVIETKSLSGDIEDKTMDSLDAYIKSERAKEIAEEEDELG